MYKKYRFKLKLEYVMCKLKKNLYHNIYIADMYGYTDY